jgi:Spy/CpxP family protein refolding chaperone
MTTPSNTPLRRARVLGLAVVVLVFTAGVAVGLAVPRRPPEGVTFRVTDRIPRELEQLDLSPEQRERIRAILVRGRPRVQAVMEDVEPRLRAAFDSTDREISAVLTPPQRAALAEARRARPQFQRRQLDRTPDAQR